MEDQPANIEKIFEDIVHKTLFIQFEKDERGDTDIPKAHYKFYYGFPLPMQGDQYILLDIVYCDNPYPKTIERNIQSPILSTEGSAETVRLPDINSILGDKLTAFAPRAIGIPIDREKELETIKQLHDIGHLFDFADDLSLIQRTF